MKIKTLFLILFVLMVSTSLFGAQIIGDIPADKSKKILRDLNIMEGLLAETLNSVEAETVHFKFSVDAFYYKGIGVIFNAGSRSNSIRFSIGDIFGDIPFDINIEIPEIPEMPEMTEIHIFSEDDGAREGAEEEFERSRKRVRIEKSEVKRLKEEIEDQKQEIEEWKEDRKKEKAIIIQKQEASKKEFLEAIDELKKVAETFYLTTLSGIRNLENSDKIILNITLPEANFEDDKAVLKTINLSCNYSDMRDFRREKLNETSFKKKIKHGTKDNSKLQKDLQSFSEIMWNLAVEDPYWMFTSKVTYVYIEDQGVLYNFNAYMVEKTLKHIKALASDIWSDEKNDKSALAELEKEQKKRRASLIEDVLETSGTYINILKNLPENENIICLFEMSDSHYGLDDASLMIKMKKRDLLDFYKEKIDEKGLEKKAEILYTPVKK